jgi:hypothetical protein
VCGHRVLAARAELRGRILVGVEMLREIGHALVLVPSVGWALPPGNVGGLPADIYRGELTVRRGRRHRRVPMTPAWVSTTRSGLRQ